MSIASPLVRPSPNGRRVGIRIVTFEACSGFTHVTARRIAQPPTATFVTRLRPCRSPGRAARQLPDQSTILWVVSSSTGDSRLQGALPEADLACWLTYATTSWRQRVEQCLGLLQKGRIEALCEPAVDRDEEIAGGIALTLLVPEPGKTDCGPQLPVLCALLLRDVDGSAKGALGTGGSVTRAQQLPPDPPQPRPRPPTLRHP